MELVAHTVKLPLAIAVSVTISTAVGVYERPNINFSLNI
mgnify:FL=1